MADNDDLLDTRIDHVVVRTYLVLAEDARRERVHRMVRRGRRGLCDGGHVFKALDVPGLVSRDDQRIAGEVDLDLAVVHEAHGRRAAQGAVIRRSGKLRAHERHVKRNVDMHREVLSKALRHRRNILRRRDLRRVREVAKDALLLDGLRSTRAHKALRTIRGDHRERRVRVARLDQRRQRVSHGRA